MPARNHGRAGRPLQGESIVASNPGAERRSVQYGDSGAPKQDTRPQLARNFLSRRFGRGTGLAAFPASAPPRAKEFPAPKRLRSAGMGELITALKAFAAAKIDHRGRTSWTG